MAEQAAVDAEALVVTLRVQKAAAEMEQRGMQKELGVALQEAAAWEGARPHCVLVLLLCACALTVCLCSYCVLVLVPYVLCSHCVHVLSLCVCALTVCSCSYCVLVPSSSLSPTATVASVLMVAR